MSGTASKSSSLIDRMRRRLEEAADLESALDALRLFRRESEKEILEADVSGDLTLPELFARLTGLAEAVLQGAVRIAQGTLAARGLAVPTQTAIVAMGKFGGRELTYGSDLDLIFLCERPEDQEGLTRLGQSMITTLTVPTRHGIAYKIDTALRPSGNAGTLVSSLPSFEEYHRMQARTWERQSLIKARPLIGEGRFLEKLTSPFDAIAYRQSPEGIAREIRHLRTRIEREIARETPVRYDLKTGRGGIIDIEFTAQYLQLKNAWRVREIRTPNTLEALTRLNEAGLLSGEDGNLLRSAYLFYREVETRLRLLAEQATDVLIRGSEMLKKVEERYFPGRDLWRECSEWRERVRPLYQEVLEE